MVTANPGLSGDIGTLPGPTCVMIRSIGPPASSRTSGAGTTSGPGRHHHDDAFVRRGLFGAQAAQASKKLAEDEMLMVTASSITPSAWDNEDSARDHAASTNDMNEE